MAKRISANFVVLILTLATVVLLVAIGLYVNLNTKDYDVIIAAGPSTAESYVLMQAVKSVAAHHYPRLKITVHDTAGTPESLQRLDKGQAQVAAVQGGVSSSSSARTVAVLFDETAQLLTHKDSPITQFPDLKGKRIGLPKTGGQFRSFLSLANHFGLHEGDFTFVGGDDQSADVAFARNEADVIFRISPVPNAGIGGLASSGNTVFLPIEQGQALHIDVPSYTPTIIPKGAYLGNPPMPAADLPTVFSPRLLLARADLDDAAVYAITQILLEHRHELAAAIGSSNAAMRPLVAGIRQPNEQSTLDAGLHPGAAAYYARAGFASSHIELIALTTSAVVLMVIWVLELRRRFARDQKNHGDEFNLKVIELLGEIEGSTSERDLEPIQAELMTLMTAAVNDLDQDKLSATAFQSFYTVWQIAIRVIREREEAFRASIKGAAATPSEQTPAAPGAAESTTARWSLMKFLQKPVT